MVFQKLLLVRGSQKSKERNKLKRIMKNASKPWDRQTENRHRIFRKKGWEQKRVGTLLKMKEPCDSQSAIGIRGESLNTDLLINNTEILEISPNPEDSPWLGARWQGSQGHIISLARA